MATSSMVLDVRAQFETYVQAWFKENDVEVRAQALSSILKMMRERCLPDPYDLVLRMIRSFEGDEHMLKGCMLLSFCLTASPSDFSPIRQILQEIFHSTSNDKLKKDSRTVWEVLMRVDMCGGRDFLPSAAEVKKSVSEDPQNVTVHLLDGTQQSLRYHFYSTFDDLRSAVAERIDLQNHATFGFCEMEGNVDAPQYSWISNWRYVADLVQSQEFRAKKAPGNSFIIVFSKKEFPKGEKIYGKSFIEYAYLQAQRQYLKSGEYVPVELIRKLAGLQLLAHFGVMMPSVEECLREVINFVPSIHRNTRKWSEDPIIQYECTDVFLAEDAKTQFLEEVKDLLWSLVTIFRVNLVAQSTEMISVAMGLVLAINKKYIFILEEDPSVPIDAVRDNIGSIRISDISLLHLGQRTFSITVKDGSTEDRYRFEDHLRQGAFDSLLMILGGSGVLSYDARESNVRKLKERVETLSAVIDELTDDNITLHLRVRDLSKNI